MDPNVKKSKKKARKAGTQAKPAIQTQSNPPAKIYNSSWEEEQLVDYDEPEEPAAFSPLEEENYSDGDDYPFHGDGPEDQNENMDEFPAYSAEAVGSVGGKRSQNVFRKGRPAARRAGVSA
jgi:hypothetical protein